MGEEHELKCLWLNQLPRYIFREYLNSDLNQQQGHSCYLQVYTLGPIFLAKLMNSFFH